jgi:hypothetical protein
MCSAIAFAELCGFAPLRELPDLAEHSFSLQGAKNRKEDHQTAAKVRGLFLIRAICVICG